MSRRRQRAQTQRVKAFKKNGLVYRRGYWWKLLGQWGKTLAYIDDKFVGEVIGYEVDCLAMPVVVMQ
jgi:hypothetical protein